MKKHVKSTTINWLQLKHVSTLKIALIFSMMLCLNVGKGQVTNGYLDFGTTANGTIATIGNTGFGGVRTGTGGGGWTIMNPGQSIGTAGELRGIAPTTTSINSAGITSTEYGTAATTFTISFELHLSGGSSGNWYFFAGNGASFASAQTNGFSGADVFTGIRWTFGASSAITTNNRAGGSWNATGLSTPFAQSTAYYVTIIGNNSSSSVNYGASNAYSVAANTYDLWVNGSLAGNDLAKAQLANSTSINAFRFYGESSTGNVAQIALDNIRWYNTCVLPPTHLALVNVPSTGTVATNISSFTAEARSGSATGPVANSFTGAITIAKISGGGAMSGTLNPNAVAGVAPYSNIQFSSADTYTINAAAAAPIVNAATSGSIVISSTCSSTSITTHPVDASVSTPSSVTFSVVATGSISAYRWQVNDGTGWNDLSNGSPYSGTDTKDLLISPTSTTLDGYQYRCVISALSPCTGTTSNAAFLTLTEGPCVKETFINTNAPTNSTYGSGSYTGDNGLTWDYTAAIEANANSYPINGKGLILRRASDGSLVKATSQNGISSFSCNLRKAFTGTGIRQVELFVNNISYGKSITFGSASGADATIIPFTVNNINISGTVTIEVRNITSNQVVIDDISWYCYSGCTSSQTITGFTPSEGPEGTIVTITGTGFTGSTSVKFGGVSSALFTVIDDNTIQAEVPNNAISGSIGITKSSCEQLSNTEFLILSSNNNCGTGSTGSDLMISEVFDSNIGALGYIEIFNPTTSGINLNNYYLRVNTGATTNLANFSSFVLASGAVAIISIGDPAVSGTSLCSSLNIQQAYNNAPGFNTTDEITLMKGTSGSGTVLDVVLTPSSSKGFTQLRNNGIINPRNTYLSSEWTNADPEACSNLGIAPTSLSSVDVTINTQPSDNTNCSTVIFSVSATASSGTITSYSWKYNDSKTMTGWLDASGLSIASGTNTATLTLSGNIADYQNYQFYCVITKTISGTTCERYSNAAQYTYNTKAFYRSKNDGSWTDASTWEMSDTENGTYINACQYPIAINSTKVNILNTHDVILDVIDLDIDWLKIQSGGSLKIENSSLLTFNNGNTSGADLEVDGTLTDNGSIGNGISFATSAGWILGSSATLIRTSNSSSSVYRNNYETGMINIPATANWIIRYIGINDVTFTTTGGTYYPNLTFESTSGLWDPLATAISSRFTGNTDFVTVKGNLDIGGSGTGTVTVYNENTNATPMQILGNLIVRTGNTLTNNGSSNGTGFEVKGNVTVDGTLTINGVTPAPANANAKLILSGSTMQTISGTGELNLLDVEIKNTGEGVTLLRPVSMNGVLTLQDGLVNTSLTNLLTLTSTATCPLGGSDDSFITGPMKKIGTAPFTFPVGKPIVANYTYNPQGNGGWRPIGVSNLGTISSDAYTAEFFLYSATEIGPVTSPGLLRVNPCEYWGLKRESSGTQNINVTLHWKPKSDCNPGSYILNSEGVTAALSSTGAPLIHNRNNPWDNHRGMGTGLANDGFVTYPNVDFNLLNTPFATDVTYKDFTPFAIGSINISQAPLPFDIKNFKATGKGKIVQLDWLINHNDEVRSYVIERSRDGIHFEHMKMVAARANEDLAAYVDVDPAPYNGWGYYRLRITDLAGKIGYSAVQKVWMGNTGTYVQVTPKPAKDRLWINLAEPEKINEMVIVNSVGQLLFKQNRFTNNNQIDISSFRPGVYYVRIVGQNGIVTEPFVKE